MGIRLTPAAALWYRPANVVRVSSFQRTSLTSLAASGAAWWYWTGLEEAIALA